MDFGELRQMFTDWASRIVRFTQIASASSDGTASVAGRAYAGGPAAPNLRRARSSRLASAAFRRAVSTPRSSMRLGPVRAA